MPQTDLLVVHAQRTRRLDLALEAVAFALGGQAGQRLALKLRMPVSGDTLLRLIRRTCLLAADAPVVIGVDEWAKRRGRTYGTLVVDLECHQAIDLLNDRTAETLADWLQRHPTLRSSLGIARASILAGAIWVRPMPNKLRTAGISWSICAKRLNDYWIVCVLNCGPRSL